MTHYSLFPAGRPVWAHYTYFDGEESLTEVECKAVMEAASEQEHHSGLIRDSMEDRQIRSVDVATLSFGGDLLPVQAKIIDAALRANDHWWGFDLTHVAKMEVCRYGTGDHFKAHTDWGSGHTTRKLSVAVLLNDAGEFDGGEWVFTNSYLEGVVVPQRGTIVVFPSFVVHRVNPVTRGERWSATAWIEGPPFR